MTITPESVDAVQQAVLRARPLVHAAVSKFVDNELKSHHPHIGADALELAIKMALIMEAATITIFHQQWKHQPPPTRKSFTDLCNNLFRDVSAELKTVERPKAQ